MASRLSSFLAELKRRKVGRVTAVYALVGVAVIEAADLILTRLTLPAWTVDFVVVLVVLGFPIALVLAWALEVTPEGIQRTADLPPDESAARATERWSPSWVGFAAASAVVILAGGYLAFFRGSGGGPEETANGTRESGTGGLVETCLAVMPFENRTGQDDLGALGAILASVLTQGVSRTGMMEVVPTSVTVGFASEAGPGGYEIVVDGEARTLADETKAGTAVRGAYYLLGDSLRIQAEISDEGTRSVLDAVEVWGKADAPMDAAGELGQRVMSHLALRFDTRLEGEGTAILGGDDLPRYEAYAAYMESMDAAYGLSQNTREVLRHAQRAFELDSTFYLPLTGALYAHVSLGNVLGADSLIEFLEAHQDELDPFSVAGLGVMRSRLRGDQEAEYQASRDLFSMQPSFGQGLWQLGWAALNVNRPREALEVLTQADPRSWSLRGEWAYWNSLTEAYHLLGHHQEELSAARRGREQFPESANALLYGLRALAALGDVPQVLAGMDELVSLRTGSPAADMRAVAQELQVHGHPEGAREVLDRIFAWYQGRPQSELETPASRYDRAVTHYLAEDWDEAEALFALIQAGEPSGSRTAEARRLFHAPGHLGVIAVRKGDREEALRISRELARADMVYINGRENLWRGRIAAVLGDLEDAMAFLREAHAQGQAFGLSWHRDPALESLRGYLPFQEFLRPKG